MSCIVLVGGVVGCGKTTLINYICDHKNDLFTTNLCNINADMCYRSNCLENESASKNRNVLKIILDDICSLQEQKEITKKVKGWKNFRVDLLMASEYYINSVCGLECKLAGPLSERSQNLLCKIENLNDTIKEESNTLFLVEDNFYYRSMRYEWFQVAKRANIGFCQVFLECPVSCAVERNSTRGFQIPEQKIFMMAKTMEYPNPSKYKWEKYSITFDSFAQLQCSSLKELIDIIIKSANNPAEVLMTEDKIEAQRIGSKNVVHQADNMLRKIVSRKISHVKEFYTDKDTQNTLISVALDVRKEILDSIRVNLGEISFSVLTSIQNSGIVKVQEYSEELLNNVFENNWIQKTSGII